MRAKDAEDIVMLYVNERHRLERQIALHTRVRSDARDLVQDIFLKLWERAGAAATNPGAFLSRSARNASIDYMRKERVRRNYRNAALAETDVEGDPNFAQLAARQSLAAVTGAIAALPDRTRRIFIMNRVDGLTFREIAENCEISERAVAKHMAKALAACAQALEPEDESRPADEF